MGQLSLLQSLCYLLPSLLPAFPRALWRWRCSWRKPEGKPCVFSLPRLAFAISNGSSAAGASLMQRQMVSRASDALFGDPGWQIPMTREELQEQAWGWHLFGVTVQAPVWLAAASLQGCSTNHTKVRYKQQMAHEWLPPWCKPCSLLLQLNSAQLEGSPSKRLSAPAAPCAHPFLSARSSTTTLCSAGGTFLSLQSLLPGFLPEVVGTPTCPQSTSHQGMFMGRLTSYVGVLTRLRSLVSTSSAQDSVDYS